MPFWTILEGIGPILGQIITLGACRCHNRAQRVWKWGHRTQNYGPSSVSTIDMHISSILTKLVQFWTILEGLGPILGQIITLGVWNCHNRAQRVRKWGYRTQNYGPRSASTIDMHISSILSKLDQFWTILESLGPILGQIITLGVYKFHTQAQRLMKWRI